MSETPTETPGGGVLPGDELQSLVERAAASAADLIPAPAPLASDPAAEVPPEPEMMAFHAEFTGTTSGGVVLVLGASIAEALEQTDEETTVVSMVEPALSSAAEAGGPCVLEAITQCTAAEVPDIEQVVFVALAAEGEPQAWIGLNITATAAATPPQQASAPAAEHVDDQEHTDSTNMRMELLRGVEMTLSVEIGRSRMLVRDLLQLSPGSVVELDRAAGEPADLLVNGRLIARGEVVVVDEEFGLRITQLITDEENAGGT